jgi:hypothetical protein
VELRIILSGDLDCFLSIGEYRVCYRTQSLSIYSRFIFLMIQALVSRIFAPDISNFVNASVRPPHTAVLLTCLRPPSNAPQILYRDGVSSMIIDVDQSSGVALPRLSVLNQDGSMAIISDEEQL